MAFNTRKTLSAGALILIAVLFIAVALVYVAVRALFA